MYNQIQRTPITSHHIINELFHKYGWQQFLNSSYSDELIFKHKEKDFFIYIFMESGFYYISVPMLHSNYNLKINCGHKNDSHLFYNIFDKLEDKLKYLQSNI